MKALTNAWTQVSKHWKQARRSTPLDWRIVTLSAEDGGKTALSEALRTPGLAARRHVVWTTPRQDRGDAPLAASRDLSTAQGHAPGWSISLSDPPGEWFSTGPESPNAEPLAEQVQRASELLLLVPPAIAFGDDMERERVLATLVRWVVLAAQSPHRGCQPLKVSVVFTKCDQYGEGGWTTRLFQSPYARRTLGRLRGQGNVDETWSRFVRTVADDTRSPELVKELLHRTRALFCGLADALGMNAIDAYLTAARPLEPVREPWGIDAVLSDSVDYAEHTRGRPRIRATWVAAMVAVALVVFGWGVLYEGRQAGQIRAFQSMLEENQFARGEQADLHRWVPSTSELAECQLADVPAWTPDVLAESLFVRRLEGEIGEVLGQLTSQDSDARASLVEKLRTLEEAGRWEEQLTARERALLSHGPRKAALEQAIARTRTRLQALQRVVEALSREATDWGELTDAIEHLERVCGVYRYLDPQGAVVWAREAYRPWLASELDEIRQARPDAFRQFLRQAPDARSETLATLGLPVNPYRDPPPRRSTRPYPELPRPGETNVVLRVRDHAGREMELDFFVGSAIQVAGPAGANAFDYADAMVISLRARARYEDALQVVQLTCRGQQELNLASVVEALTNRDSALSVVCVDPQLARLTAQTLVEAFAQRQPSDDWLCRRW